MSASSAEDLEPPPFAMAKMNHEEDHDHDHPHRHHHKDSYSFNSSISAKSAGVSTQPLVSFSSSLFHRSHNHSHLPKQDNNDNEDQHQGRLDQKRKRDCYALLAFASLPKSDVEDQDDYRDETSRLTSQSEDEQDDEKGCWDNEEDNEDDDVDDGLSSSSADSHLSDLSSSSWLSFFMQTNTSSSSDDGDVSSSCSHKPSRAGIGKTANSNCHDDNNVLLQNVEFEIENLLMHGAALSANRSKDCDCNDLSHPSIDDKKPPASTEPNAKRMKLAPC